MRIVSSGKVLNSAEFYEKKKRKKRLRLYFFLVAFLVLLLAVIYISRHRQLLISEVTILSEDTADADEIIQAVGRLLSGHYFLVFPRSNALLYPRETIERSLLEEFPRLKSVDLNLSNLQRLFVTVEERTPFALYCTHAHSPADIADCYLIDEEGFIFAPAPAFSGDVYFVYTTQNPIENPLAKRFLAATEFKSLTKFIERLEMLKIEAMILEVWAEEYRVKLPSGGEIIFRRESDLSLIYSNLEAFLSSDAIRTQSDFLDKIQSLDLRTENKVFYKFKD
jgi:hypothetical protein